MAGIAIPENLRPTLAAVAKYHFWILAAVVPLLLVPLLFVGGSGLRSLIAAQRTVIESKLGQARAVAAVQPHPNEAWLTAITADTDAVGAETLAEWRRFWHAQATLRTWPAELGDAFLEEIAKLPPGGKLDRPSLVRYQNMAPRLVRSLPVRMGVADAMLQSQPDGGAGAPARPEAAALAPKLTWSPSSQQRLHASFMWNRPPTTTQVLLAQEELWVYGLFCDLLAGFVQKATGAHDSPLTLIEELAVGFPAIAVSGQGQSRIILPKPPADAGDGTTDSEPAPNAAGDTRQIWHPRFSSAPPGGQARGTPSGPDEQPAGSPDDDYRGWIYVDLEGKPLSAAELAAAPDMQLVHLMPFVLRVVIDQRQLDRLLATLAAVPIPIDVREVRVNPGSVSASPGPAPGPSTAAVGRRPNDVVVELRGSVALATRPAAGATSAEAAP